MKWRKWVIVAVLGLLCMGAGKEAELKWQPNGAWSFEGKSLRGQGGTILPQDVAPIADVVLRGQVRIERFAESGASYVAAVIRHTEDSYLFLKFTRNSIHVQRNWKEGGRWKWKLLAGRKVVVPTGKWISFEFGAIGEDIQARVKMGKTVALSSRDSSPIIPGLPGMIVANAEALFRNIKIDEPK